MGTEHILSTGNFLPLGKHSNDLNAQSNKQQQTKNIPAMFPKAHTACSVTFSSGEDSNMTNLGTAPVKGSHELHNNNRTRPHQAKATPGQGHIRPRPRPHKATQGHKATPGQGQGHTRPHKAKATQGQGQGHTRPRPHQAKATPGQGQGHTRPHKAKATQGQGQGHTRPRPHKAKDLFGEKLVQMLLYEKILIELILYKTWIEKLLR